MERHPDCAALLQRAQRVLAGGPGTFSKHPSRYPEGFAPAGLVSGEGTYVVGTDGRTYLDTVGSLGANLLGYGHPDVTEALIAQLQCGLSFSMLTEREVQVAETLGALLPCAEMVRFAKNGTDATGMATRLARAVTGKKHVVFVGYSGGACDSYGITTSKAAGLLPELRPFNHQVSWSDLRLEPLIAALGHPQGSGLACVMLEVPALPWGTAPQVIGERLKVIQEATHTAGALFILDEVVTFPRYHVHGAQGLYGVTPDLCTVSKGMANGLPLAALAGPRDLMSRFNVGDIFASWTFAGECLSLAACQATLDVCQLTGALDVIHAQGQRFGAYLQDLMVSCALPATLVGNYARLALQWHDVPGVATAAELRTLWMQESARRGVLYGIGVVFPNSCWTDGVLQTLERVAREVADVIARAVDGKRVRGLLECPVIEDVLSVR